MPVGKIGKDAFDRTAIYFSNVELGADRACVRHGLPSMQAHPARGEIELHQPHRALLLFPKREWTRGGGKRSISSLETVGRPTRQVEHHEAACRVELEFRCCCRCLP